MRLGVQGPLRTGLLSAGLAIAALAVYLPAVDAYFVGDDWDFLAAGISSFGAALRHTFWGVYMPVFTVSFWIDSQLWGLDPLGYHLSSLLFHAAATVSAFFLARALAHGDRFVGGIAALLFALHPVHDEAVIYIAARAHLACTTFMLFALYFHVRNRQTGGTGYLGRSLICFVLALLSKETALVTPLLIATVDLLLFPEGGRWLRRAVLGVRPYGLVCAAYLLVRFFMADPSGDKLALPGLFGWRPGRLAEYFLLEFLPIPSTLFGAATLERLAMPATLALVVLAVWVWRRRAVLGPLPYTLVFFVVTSLPFLAGTLSLRRRYAYAGSFGACLFLAAALVFLIRSHSPTRRAVGKGLLAALLLACTAATVERGLLNRRSGDLVRNIAEDLQTFIPAGTEEVRLRLLQLPRWTRGGPLRGAYLLHATDLKSIVKVFRGVEPSLRTAFKLRHAEDHTARAVHWDERTVAMKLSCRTEAAYASLQAEIEDGGKNELGTLRAGRAAPAARELRLYVQLERPFEPDEIVLYYSDGHLQRLDTQIP